MGRKILGWGAPRGLTEISAENGKNGHFRPQTQNPQVCLVGADTAPQNLAPKTILPYLPRFDTILATYYCTAMICTVYIKFDDSCQWVLEPTQEPCEIVSVTLQEMNFASVCIQNFENQKRVYRSCISNHSSFLVRNRHTLCEKVFSGFSGQKGGRKKGDPVRKT